MVEFLAIIHGTLGSITSINEKVGRKGTEEEKENSTRENVVYNGCCLSYMGSRARGISSVNEFENSVSNREAFYLPAPPKNKQTEARQTVQPLIALATLADWSSVLSTQIRWLIMAWDSSSRRSDNFSWPLQEAA